ncbi:hypothetical protein [Paenibacillus oryzisoli]|uniref:Uncharacterized protein n=1 Tax=Paenibacillus oryzisoli TaxID=1850517 RepID=A0A198A2J8_9BACL|nr:hypothetical protein [Paenibacillus oryzisoli]OAS15400.1 hypothetical protein A8708_04405 [Paenibacillus oryzisoli]
MTDILEAVVDVMKTISNEEPKSPLHVGLNTTMDNELRQTHTDSKEQCDVQAKRLSEFMIQEGH